MLSGVTLPYAYVIGPGYPFPVLCLYVAGAALGILGALLLLINLVYAIRPRWRFLDPLARPQLVSELGNGLLLGLGAGLLGGIIFNLVQIPIGYLSFLPPHTPIDGALCGIGLGILAGTLGGRLRTLPLSLVVGLAAGVGSGLMALELSSGPLEITQEAAIGDGGIIGSELALLCGILGGLVGALLVTLVTDAMGRKSHWWLRVLIGTGAGLVGGLAVAFLGALSGQLVLAVPADLVALGWRSLFFWQSASVVTQGLLYGFATFGIAGLLCGGVAGGLAAPYQPADRAPEVSQTSSGADPLHWTILVLGLLLGLIGGLSLGLSYKLLGGAPGFAQTILSTNPQGSMLTLVLGSLVGITVGIGLAMLWNRSEPRAGTRANTGKNETLRAAAACVALVILGLVVFWLPGWFTPLVVWIFGGH